MRLLINKDKTGSRRFSGQKPRSGRKKETLYPSISERREAASPYRRLPWRFSETSEYGSVAVYPPVSYGYPHEADLPLYQPAFARGFFWQDEEWEGEDPNLAHFLRNLSV